MLRPSAFHPDRGASSAIDKPYSTLLSRLLEIPSSRLLQTWLPHHYRPRITGRSLKHLLSEFVMFYEPGKTDHGLPHDPFKACVVPRPIGWVGSVSPTGVHNLAPYSQFNNLTFDPPYVMFSANQTPSGRRKDTVANAEATGRFTWNLATWDLREAVNASAEQVPADVDEFERAGLEKEFTQFLKEPRVPMVKRSPVKFECEYHSTLRLPGNPPMGTVDVVIGKVVAVHIADEVLTDGILDVKKTQPIARCGYYQYAVIRETFDMVIPSTGQWGEDILSGLEGSSRKNKEIGKREKTEPGEGEGDA